MHVYVQMDAYNNVHGGCTHGEQCVLYCCMMNLHPHVPLCQVKPTLEAILFCTINCLFIAVNGVKVNQDIVAFPAGIVPPTLGILSHKMIFS